MILPKFKQDPLLGNKRGIVKSFISGFIGLTYEGEASYLHYKRQKVPYRIFGAMERNVDLGRNRILHLENLVIISGVYNAESIEKILKTINKLHAENYMD